MLVLSTECATPPTMAGDESANHATFILNFLEMVRRQDATSAK
jgi:hypothetical protein